MPTFVRVSGGGGIDTSTLTTIPENVLIDKTFIGISGFIQAGTMPNNNNWTQTATTNGDVIIPAGFHGGAGYVRVNIPGASFLGNAVPSEVLNTRTFYSTSNTLQTGTMTNNGAWTQTATSNGQVIIPSGYHNGSGYVNVSVSGFTFSGNATVAEVLAGRTFYSNSASLQNGTMVNRGAWTTSTTSNGNITVPSGYHNGNGYVTVNVPTVSFSGNAGTAQVLSGYSFYSNSSTLQNGTMTNRGTYTITRTTNGNVPIPEGYHNGSGYVTVNVMATVATGTVYINMNWQTVYHNLGYIPTVTVGYYEQTDIGTTTRYAVKVRNINTSSFETCIQGSSPTYYTVRWVAL